MTRFQGKRIDGFRTGSATDKPLESIFRLYQFFVVGWTSRARSELEYFWSQADWSVYGIPDPQHPDPITNGVLAVLVRLMCEDFNALIEKGHQRGSSLTSEPILAKADEGKEGTEGTENPASKEKLPEWVEFVPRVTDKEEEWVSIPNPRGYPSANDPGISEAFKNVGILVTEPQFRLH